MLNALCVIIEKKNKKSNSDFAKKKEFLIRTKKVLPLFPAHFKLDTKLIFEFLFFYKERKIGTTCMPLNARLIFKLLDC